jgi:hypothetical protein
LAGTLDTLTNTLTANISHFTTFALVSPTAADISLTTLDVLPAQATIGDKISITLTLENRGGKEGSYALKLSINGALESEKNVMVSANSIQKFTFEITKQQPDNYFVAIGNLTGTFKISQPSPSVTPERPEPIVTTSATPSSTPIASPSIAPTTIRPSQQPGITATPEERVSTPLPPQSTGPASTISEPTSEQASGNLNWLLISLVSAGVLIIGLIQLFIFKRRSK